MYQRHALGDVRPGLDYMGMNAAFLWRWPRRFQMTVGARLSSAVYHRGGLCVCDEAVSRSAESGWLASADRCLVKAEAALVSWSVVIAVAWFGLPHMERSLIWIGGDGKGWACSNCQWRFPVPTLLGGEEAKSAYDRLAAGKFREHKCEAGASPFAVEQETRQDSSALLAERARALIKRGYTPKVAVELVLHEMEFEHGSNSRLMEKARADGEDFLLRVRKGLI